MIKKVKKLQDLCYLNTLLAKGSTTGIRQFAVNERIAENVHGGGIICKILMLSVNEKWLKIRLLKGQICT